MVKAEVSGAGADTHAALLPERTALRTCAELLNQVGPAILAITDNLPGGAERHLLTEQAACLDAAFQHAALAAESGAAGPQRFDLAAGSEDPSGGGDGGYDSGSKKTAELADSTAGKANGSGAADVEAKLGSAGAQAGAQPQVSAGRSLTAARAPQ